MPFPSSVDRTLGMETFSRTSVFLIRPSWPLRRIQSTTSLPGAPRMRATASCVVMLTVDSSSILTTSSSALMPSRWAGVPSSGEMIVSFPLRTPMYAPTPPISPSMWTKNSLYSLGEKTFVCGSRTRHMPLAIAYLAASISSAVPLYVLSTKRMTRSSTRASFLRFSSGLSPSRTSRSAIVCVCPSRRIVYTSPSPPAEGSGASSTMMSSALFSSACSASCSSGRTSRNRVWSM